MSQFSSDQPSFRENPPAERLHMPRQLPARRALPRYRVILLYDAGKELMFVVRTVMELTRLCRAEATHKMWESYHCGRSVLLVTYKERAELYVEQFAGKGLPTTLEAE